MSFNTVKTVLPAFTASIPSAATAGKAKLALSLWLRWTGRVANNYDVLFGSSFNYGTETYSFQVKWSGTARLGLRVALDNSGVKYQPSQLLTSESASQGVWNHWLFQYDNSLSTQLIKCYLNGTLDSNVTPAILALPLWTVGANYDILLPGNATAADTTDYGEIALYAGDSIPSLTDWTTYRAGGALPAGPVVHYPLIGSPDATVSSLPESIGSYTLSGAGSGTLTSEIPGLSPSIRIKSGTCYVMASGEQVHTEWETDGGVALSAATKAASLFPNVRLNGGGWTQMPYRVVKTNKVRWVIPAACRPDSAEDVVEIDFPEGLIRPSESELSHASTETPTNNYGTPAYSLPETRTAVVGSSEPNLVNGLESWTFRDAMLMAGDWYIYVGVVLNERGIPVSTTRVPPVAYCSNYSTSSVFPDEDVYLFWRGDGSDVSLSGLTPSATDTVSYGGYTWNRARYTLTTGPLIRVETDGAGLTHLEDLMLMRVSDWAGFSTGSVMTPEWIERRSSLAYIRHMDSTGGVNCNAWDITHIQPDDYVGARETHTITGTISAIETTSDPDGYFGTSGTLLKVTFSAPHSFHNGQRCTFAGTSATIGGVAMDAMICSVRTDVSGYTSSQLEVRLSAEGEFVYTSGGTLSCAISYLPAPKWFAAMHNELYAAYALCTRCWVNMPHAATDAFVTQYAEDLHAELNAAIELWFEYSNETWNSAFEGQCRYVIGEAALLGISATAFHAKRSYEIYKLLAAACPGRTVRLVMAGQSVTASVLTGRMTALAAELEADTDPSKPTWANLPVIMSVSNYHDGPNTTTGHAEGDVNQVGVPQLGPLGVAECYSLGFRDLSAYTAIIASYSKPLYAYEGGFAWDAPSDMTDLSRAIFAGQLTIEAARETWENFRRVEAWGYSGVCVLSLDGSWSEETGKSWSLCYSPDQQPGAGDGSDGLYDNLGDVDANLADYRADGTTGWDSFVSPRLYAIDAWGAPVDTTIRGFHSPQPWLMGLMGTPAVVDGVTPWIVDQATAFMPGAVESNWFGPGVVQANAFMPGAEEANVISA